MIGTSELVLLEDDFEYVLNQQEEISDGCPNQDALTAVLWNETAGDTFIDVNFDGDLDPGDYYVFDGNQIVSGSLLSGEVSGECVVTQNNDTYCAISFEFNQGTVTALGNFVDGMVITGGSNCFFGMTGTIFGSTLDNGASYQYNVVRDLEVQDLPCPNGIFSTAWVEDGNDEFVDYDQDGENSPGDLYLFDGNSVTAGDVTATSSGRCYKLVNADIDDTTYCTMNFVLDAGRISMQGFFTNMVIVGGTGCFRDLKGTVQGSQPLEEVFEYVFIID